VHDVAVMIDNMRSVTERMARIEGEEFVFDGNGRIVSRGNRLKQFECTGEFRVKDGTGHAVAALRTAGQKEPTTHPLISLLDRNVLAGHPRVPDEIRSRRQSAKPATDDMRPHQPSPWTTRLGGFPDPMPLTQATGRDLSKKAQCFQLAPLLLCGLR